MSDAPVLEMQSIRKEYFGTAVLRGVDLALNKGEVHALLGENGAGKSTLMNILFGMPVIAETGGYEGKIILGGDDVKVPSPAAAMELGIGMVHQEFMLLAGFTIFENIKLNRERLRGSPSVLADRLGGGSVVLLIDNTNFRGYWRGTNRLFLNALFFGNHIQVP